MKKQENLDITIDQSCSWCFLDPDGVFGSPSALLGNGTYYKTIPSTTYGLFVPVKQETLSSTPYLWELTVRTRHWFPTRLS